MHFTIYRGKGSRDTISILPSTFRHLFKDNGTDHHPRKQAELFYRWMFRNLPGEVLEELAKVLKAEVLGE